MKWLPRCRASRAAAASSARSPRRCPRRRGPPAQRSACRSPRRGRSSLYLPADSGTASSIASRSRDSGFAAQVIAHQPGADGDHAAADVHPHRGGHDRAERRDHRPDGRALAQVRVRHQRQVRPDERHGRGPLGLLPGARLQDRRPVDQLLGQVLHNLEPPVVLSCENDSPMRPSSIAASRATTGSVPPATASAPPPEPPISAIRPLLPPDRRTG